MGYQKFCKKLSNVLSVITGILLFVVFVIQVTNIICRNIHSISVLILQVVSKMSLVLMIYNGACVLYYKGDHLVMDFLNNLFSKNVKKAINWITIVITLLLLVVMVVYGISISMTRMTIPFESSKAVPTGWMYLAVPFAGFVMILFTFDHVIRMVKEGIMYEPEVVSKEEKEKEEQEIREGISELKHMSEKGDN